MHIYPSIYNSRNALNQIPSNSSCNCTYCHLGFINKMYAWVELKKKKKHDKGAVKMKVTNSDSS